MKINQKQKDGIHILELEGELDFHTSPNLRDRLHQFADKKIGKVLVNLKKINYIDSSGLATFVEAFQKIKRYDGKLVLAGLAPAVRSVFEIAKLDSVFSLAASEDEAISLLN